MFVSLVSVISFMVERDYGKLSFAMEEKIIKGECLLTSCYVFIKIVINLMDLLKVLFDTFEINNVKPYKDILNFVPNNVLLLRNTHHWDV